MISCQEARDMLSPYIDGQLIERDRRRVQNHLHSCEACRDEMTEMLRLEKALRETHASGDPGSDHMESLAGGFSHRFDLEAGRAKWVRPRRWRSPALLNRVPQRWMPALRIAFLTAALAGIVLAARHAGRLTSVPQEVNEKAPARRDQTLADVNSASAPGDGPDVGAATPQPETPSVSAMQSPEETRDGIDSASTFPLTQPPGEGPPAEALIAFFTGILGSAEQRTKSADQSFLRAMPDAAVEGMLSHQDDAADAVNDYRDDAGDAALQEENDSAERLLILERREADPSLPDEVWAQMWRVAARSLADRAMQTAHHEDCLLALRAYWRISNRGGRALQTGLEGEAAEYEQERSRLEHLVRCASEQR